MEYQPVPVTILTGFLGAGKSTLLTYILNENHGKRIAVIQNEFAESFQVENALLQSNDGQVYSDWVELDNGCICCTVRDEFVTALENLMKKRDKFDYVVIETTGMADPGPIAGTFWVDDQLESSVTLDGIVTVVDLKNVLRQIDEDPQDESVVNECIRQIAFADRILLNKVDLVDDDTRVKIAERVNEINSVAEVQSTEFSKVDLDFVLGIHAFKLERALTVDPSIQESALAHRHKSSTVTTMSFQICEPVEEDAINQVLGTLLWEETAMEIFRMKGIIHVKGSEKKHLVQGVRELFDVSEGPLWEDGEDRTTRIVFIGRDLDREIISKHFEAAFGQ